MIWMLLVLLYGVFKGFREIAKKKAMEDCSVMEILFFYSLLAFLMTIPTAGDALQLPTRYFGLIALKSFVIFVAWIMGFVAIKKMPISTYGVLDLSRVLFSTFLSITVLHEIIKTTQVFGLILVCLGLLLLPFHKKAKQDSSGGEVTEVNASSGNSAARKLTVGTVERPSALYVAAAFVSCLLNALSGLMDKLFMKDVSSSQLQFWYMLYLVILYLLFILVRRIPLRLSALKNKWIWVLSILFVIADKALFVANAYPDSKVSVMTLLKQAGCIVTILAGRFLFKEKNTGHKFFCAAIIITGIVLGSV